MPNELAGTLPADDEQITLMEAEAAQREPDSALVPGVSDPFAEMDREDREDRERDRRRAEYEACGRTVELREVRGRLVAEDGARLTEGERKFWSRCDTERRRQSAPPAPRLRVQHVRRTCQGSRRPRARRVRRAHAPPGDSSGGDSEPGEPARRTEQHLAPPRASAAARFAELHLFHLRRGEA